MPGQKKGKDFFKEKEDRGTYSDEGRGMDGSIYHGGGGGSRGWKGRRPVHYRTFVLEYACLRSIARRTELPLSVSLNFPI